ncbi:MAG: hypothetical protein JWM74_305, partial [Myxococcaceae bacterium]|nr:hypothetical protein [Myxococcaceae bacterium]
MSIVTRVRRFLPPDALVPAVILLVTASGHAQPRTRLTPPIQQVSPQAPPATPATIRQPPPPPPA